jgi:hypothetical protein
VLLVVGVVLSLPALFVLVVAIGGLLAAADRALAVLILAVAVLVPAVAHIAAAIGVFLQKPWARRLGMAIAAMGVFLGLVLVLTEMRAPDGPRVSVPLVLAVVAYGFTFLGLARREPAST